MEIMDKLLYPWDHLLIQDMKISLENTRIISEMVDLDLNKTNLEKILIYLTACIAKINKESK